MSDNPDYTPHFIKNLIPLLKDYLPPTELEEEIFINEVEEIATKKPSKN
jgi:hypothetical protein